MRRPVTMPSVMSARAASVWSSICRGPERRTADGSTLNSASVPSKSVSSRTWPSTGLACQAASAFSTPRTEPRIARFDELTQRDGGVDHAHVCVCLGKISEQHPGLRLDVFGEQTKLVGVSGEAVKKIP